MDGHVKLVLSIAMDDVLTPKQQTAIRECFGFNGKTDRSIREIARDFGISDMAIRDHVKEGLKRLRNSEYRHILADLLDAF